MTSDCREGCTAVYICVFVCVFVRLVVYLFDDQMSQLTAGEEREEGNKRIKTRY